MPTPFEQDATEAEQQRDAAPTEDNDLSSLLSTASHTDEDAGSDFDTVPWPIIAPNVVKPG